MLQDLHLYGNIVAVRSSKNQRISDGQICLDCEIHTLQNYAGSAGYNWTVPQWNSTFTLLVSGRAFSLLLPFEPNMLWYSLIREGIQQIRLWHQDIRDISLLFLCISVLKCTNRKCSASKTVYVLSKKWTYQCFKTLLNFLTINHTVYTKLYMKVERSILFQYG